MFPLFKCNRQYRFQLSSSASLSVKTRDRSKVGEDGSQGLHADDVWPGSLVISDFLIENPNLCKGKYVVEFGAGAALPGIVASKLEANKVVITDYPSESVLKNIEQVVEDNNCNSNVVVIPFKWGDDTDALLQPISPAKYQLVRTKSHKT